MKIAVASGKGGTGKTLIATSMALSFLGSMRYLDCDVEEPNGAIILKPEIKVERKVEKLIPEVDVEKCNLCGMCQQVCAYQAITVLKKKVMVFPGLCHGCGACKIFCPSKAITENGLELGKIGTGISSRGNSDEIDFVEGRLRIGEPMATPLIRDVKKEINDAKLSIIDSPPGTSCPVIESVKGCDYALLVTEATPFGFNDLKLAVATFKTLDLKRGVIINKANGSEGKIEEFCRKEGLSLLMKIPLKRRIAEGYSIGKTLVQILPRYIEEFRKIQVKIENSK